MFKCEYATFVNSYDFEESYVSKTLRSYRTGHIHRGSAFETDDSCGNCDGGRCDSCIEVFAVTKYGKPVCVVDDRGWEEWRDDVLSWKSFTDKQEALDYYESL